MEKNLIVGIVVLCLTFYSGLIVNFCPSSYFRFFEHIASKIVFLLVIGVVSFYSPLIALFLAIAFIINLQMANRALLGKMSVENLDMQMPSMPIPRSEDDFILPEDETLVPKSRKDVDRINKMNEQKALKMAKQMIKEKNDKLIEDAKNGKPMKESFTNQMASCTNQCNGSKSTNDTLNNECSVVQTWKNQISAQGLQCPTGYSPEIGFPVNE